MPTQVFVSYAKPDSPVAMRLCEALERQGVRCWIAPRDVPPSESYAGAIVRAIQNATLFVVVLSHATNDSPHVLNEIERAFARQIPIIPFRIAEVSPNEDIQYFLSRPQWIDAYEGSFDAHVAKVVEFVASTSKRPPPKEAALTVAGPPPARVERPPAPSAGPAPAAVVRAPPEGAPPAAPLGQRGRRAIAAAVAVALVAGWFWFSRQTNSGPGSKGVEQASREVAPSGRPPTDPLRIAQPTSNLGQWVDDPNTGDSIRVLDASPPSGTKLEGSTEFRLRIEYKLKSQDRAMLIVAFVSSSEDGTGCDSMGRRPHTPFTARASLMAERGEGTVEATASGLAASGKGDPAASGFLAATPAFWKIDESGRPFEIAAQFPHVACWAF